MQVAPFVEISFDCAVPKIYCSPKTAPVRERIWLELTADPNPPSTALERAPENKKVASLVNKAGAGSVKLRYCLIIALAMKAFVTVGAT